MIAGMHDMLIGGVVGGVLGLLVGVKIESVVVRFDRARRGWRRKL